MSASAKILVILLFILSMAFVVVSLKAYGHIDAQDRLIADLIKKSGEQTGTAEAMGTAIGSAKDKINTLNGNISQLTTDLDTMTEAKAQVETELADEKDAKAKAEGERDDALAAQKSAESKVAGLESKISGLNGQVASLTEDINAAREQSNKVTKELNGIRSILAAYPQQWEKMKNPQAAGMNALGSGKVFTVKDHGINSVVFHGTTTVSKGDSFSVLRDNLKIGKYVVGDVYRTVVICQETGGKLQQPLQKGDVLKP